MMPVLHRWPVPPAGTTKAFILLAIPVVTVPWPVVAAPPLGVFYQESDPWTAPPVRETPARSAPAAAMPRARSEDVSHPAADQAPVGEARPTTAGADETGNDPPPQEPLTECPPHTPHRISSTICVSQAIIDQVNDGWQAAIDPTTGQIAWTPPPTYDPTTGQWGNYQAATQACDPNIDVTLKQAALAGSQMTRAISDRQLSYPEVDPLAAVNNPQKDGYGGVCTIDLFAFDLGRLLGTTYDQIQQLINTLSHFSVDALFGAACNVVNTVFGDLQNQLLQDLQSSAPLTAFQQFVNALQMGYVAPLHSLVGYGLTVRPTAATLPGVTTLQPLQVTYVSGKGYVYLADLGGGNVVVLRISPTPLAPEDVPP